MFNDIKRQNLFEFKAVGITLVQIVFVTNCSCFHIMMMVKRKNTETYINKNNVDLTSAFYLLTFTKKLKNVNVFYNYLPRFYL